MTLVAGAIFQPTNLLTALEVIKDEVHSARHLFGRFLFSSSSSALMDASQVRRHEQSNGREPPRTSMSTREKVHLVCGHDGCSFFVRGRTTAGKGTLWDGSARVTSCNLQHSCSGSNTRQRNLPASLLVRSISGLQGLEGQGKRGDARQVSLLHCLLPWLILDAGPTFRCK